MCMKIKVNLMKLLSPGGVLIGLPNINVCIKYPIREINIITSNGDIIPN